MATCPSCGSDIGDDFGIVQCANCHAVLAVDFDGHVEVNASKSSENNLAENSADDSAPPPLAAEFAELVIDEVSGVYEVPTTPETLAETPPEEAVAFEPLSDEEIASPQVESEPDRSAPAGDVRGPVEMNLAEEIRGFANSNDQLVDGSLHYDLFIDGIDTADVRLEVKEALQDKKFIWDADALIRSVRNGRLSIPGVTAVKAAILVQRLSYLPVKLSWVQHATFDR